MSDPANHSAPAAGAPAHPLAGKAMTGAEIIVQVLADEGVEAIFGYSGGAILPTYDAVFTYNEARRQAGGREIPLIVPANEQGAGFMAAGYARASGKVGVCLVTSGPGATNTVTPVRDCLADSVPIVVFCGQVPTGAIGTDAFQEAPVAALMGSVSKHVFLVTDPKQLEATVRTAFEIARSGRPGPVVVDLPKDVQNWNGAYRGEGRLAIPGYRRRTAELAASTVSPAQAAAFVDLLSESHRPLIYAGGGVINGEASRDLREFADALQIPVVTTLMGIGAYDTTEPHALHMLGMHGIAYANYAVEDCDFLICIGARFDDRVAGDPKKFARGARAIAHLDVDRAEINKVKQARWHHVGLLPSALAALRAAVQKAARQRDYAPWLGHLASLKQRYGMNYRRDGELVQPHHVLEEINKITRGEAIISTGVGQHQMWAAQMFDFRHPRLWLTSGSMGTMGFGLPAAIGAQVANPGRLVIDIDGDASIRMNVGELETATTYNLPVKIVVLNNYGDGMVKQWQKLFFKGRLSGSDKSLHKKDFIKAAQADGFAFARRLERREEVAATVAEFLAFEGPAFLEVIIDGDAGVYPMVGPGQGYDAMITGDYIPSRDARDAAPVDPSSMF
jgi:acetolactate synthase I/II/III large subunit